MFFLNPTYLWAFLGFLVPIGIHLWSKKEGRTIKIGSIQLLQESDSKQTSSIQINEWWLLLLRLVILGLIVLILAGPRLKHQVVQEAVTYLVDPILLNDEKFNLLLDSLETKHGVHLLQEAFPRWNQDNTYNREETIPGYWQLAKDLESFPSDSFVVYTSAYVSGIKGVRPKISKNINWIFIEADQPNSQPVAAISKENKVQILYAKNSTARLGFTKKTFANDQVKIKKNRDSVKLDAGQGTEVLSLLKEKPLAVEIYYTPQLDNERRYIHAALNAISNYLEIPVEIFETRDADSLNLNSKLNLIWLSEAALPETSQKVMIYKPDSLSDAIMQPGASGNIWQLSRPLNPENIVNEHFAEKLIGFLDPYQSIEEKAFKYDRRIMDREEFIPVFEKGITSLKKAESTNISHWFWFVLFPVLIGERLLSKYRKQ